MTQKKTKTACQSFSLLIKRPTTQAAEVAQFFFLRKVKAIAMAPLPSVLMVGTGEYTTGYVNGAASASDKSCGVVALTIFDLRRRGLVGRVGMCGVNGGKFEGIRRHMKELIEGRYSDMSTECETFPEDGVVDKLAYKKAVKTFSKGDLAIIFTPDDTHFDIAEECIRAGMHVLVTKPIVKVREAAANGARV